MLNNKKTTHAHRFTHEAMKIVHKPMGSLYDFPLRPHADKSRLRAIKSERRTRRLQPTLASPRGEMAKNFYQYNGPKGQTLYGYERQYKNKQLRKKGFLLKRDAEKHLRQAMDDADAEERGEIRPKPTTAQEALEIYRRELNIRARTKDYNYAHTNNSTIKVIQQFVDHFGPNRRIRECTETDLREFYQILCFRPSVHKNTAGSLIGRIQGMFKAAQQTKPDLVTWLRPKLKVSSTPKFDQANGFTCHSLRHTFITDMMEATDKDVALVMSWSGHKSLESFRIYLHPSEKGRILGAQHTDSVADFLRTFTGRPDKPGKGGAIPAVVKPLKPKQVAL